MLTWAKEWFAVCAASLALVASVFALAMSGSTTAQIVPIDSFATLTPTCASVLAAIQAYESAVYQGELLVKQCRSVTRIQGTPHWLAVIRLAEEWDTNPQLYDVELQYSPFSVINVGLHHG